ncbi:undecaprenyldiphospho-muramoylpentapeptide beta-N-acetylglucosaminyltransferase [Pelagibacterium lacus]|uniref:UDP-N-acetylglucosamine--N-acetylmuramyl-(pentapeptide) pyrophosphoryl-undecaprenol N-acetylglucosamine transferase n=1 Tax=Pelagibacterium lacus TaxID=2282655 RepID=A0A369W456_9HYPH|nr:undecaprenyldiphospho-muramoylpentapeptide beta-N-acetylglucosaminyltransferase [Pelagibacterium lacus]RDE09103.1 undecaprenyldiphospho-muramoylpentapeptide beta-N-acetylglucosaminyltransferase [Pelagibacterium lacus]
MSTFALMAGGTGGHLFPAMALAQELRRRGHDIHLVTDERIAAYGADFPASAIHIVPAATPSIRNPLKFAQAGFTILGGVGTALGILRKVRPDAVVGFGGYPCFPPFLAASLLRIPGILHEQNAVMGRANRALARFASVLALSFAETIHAEGFGLPKVVTGNPVRDRVRAVAGTPYRGLSDNAPIALLVFGGSQGARAFSDIVPVAIALLDESLRRRLDVTQQCREEDLDRVAEIYRGARVNVDLARFFTDLPERIAASHLVIGRAGASTVAELGVLGRPAILVPLPGSLDQDQRANAMVMEKGGGAWLCEQATLSPQSLATQLNDLLLAPDRLARAAEAAQSVGVPDAVERLADLVEQTAKGQS